jgi:hypothetical protein
MPPPGMDVQPVYPPQPRVQAPAVPPPRPVVRGSPPEDKKPARREPVTLPPPEQLGIAPPPPAPKPVDWDAVRARVKELGALNCGLDSAEGGFCFSVIMPTAEKGRTHRIDGYGPTHADAVRDCLGKTERWLGKAS